MPGDQGSQVVSIIFHASAQSSIVNRRHKDTRMLGIYKGGYITLVPPSNVSLSALVCEISDGIHQVRVETTAAVSLVVAKTTKEYVVLRWIYTGVAADDYMAILAVASPLTNDIIVGKCSFTVPGVLQGFDYGERSDPDIQHLFLQVEPTGDVELRVRIRGGRIQTNSGVVDIPDQLSDLFTPPGSNKRTYLVYVTAAGVITIDSSGTAAATPVAPSYKGNLVLAEVTLTAGDTSITADKIQDVRNWITQPIVLDGTTIALDSSGKLAVVTTPTGAVGSNQLASAAVIPSKVDSIFGSWTNLNSLGSVLVAGSVYKVGSDGFVCVHATAGSYGIIGYTDSSNPPTTVRMIDSYPNPGGFTGLLMPVRKNDYWKITATATVVIDWLPIGSGTCVKQ